MRSFFVGALCLSLTHPSFARVAHSYRDLISREPDQDLTFLGGVKQWFARSLRRSIESRQDDFICYEDDYYNFTATSYGEEFCQVFLDLPDTTTIVDYAPTSTFTNFLSTEIRGTTTDVDYVTPLTTVTVTYTAGGSPSKREAKEAIIPKPHARERRIKDAFRRFASTSSTSGSGASSSISSAFSSACYCHDYSGPTIVETSTMPAVTRTLNAFVEEYATVNTTITESTSTVTVTDGAPTPNPTGGDTTTTSPAPMSGTGGSTANPTSPTTMPSSGAAPSGAAPSGGAPTGATSTGAVPTGTAIACPQANGTLFQQMVQSEDFEYTILCNTILGDADFYNVLNYDTLGECIAACSSVNYQFDGPVCQGVSYYGAAGSPGGGNCHLKSSASQPFASDGIDTAILQSVQLGVTNGSATSPAPFSGPSSTGDPQQMSSSMQSIMSNSSTSMSTVPPTRVRSGLLENAPITSYSTYVSDGSTYSSGTGYTFATTYSNGSWISEYYTSYTETWARATSVYGATETGFVIVNSTDSSSSEQPGSDGGYSIITVSNTTTNTPSGYNVTEVISNQTYNAQGSEVHSTATTHYYSFQTGGASSGGASGSPPQTSAGNITSSYSYPNSTTRSAPTGTPQSAVTNTYATAFSTGTTIRGQVTSGSFSQGGGNRTAQPISSPTTSSPPPFPTTGQQYYTPSSQSSVSGPMSVSNTSSPSGGFSQPMGNRTGSPFPPPTSSPTSASSSPSGPVSMTNTSSSSGTFSQPNGNRTGSPFPSSTSSPTSSPPPFPTTNHGYYSYHQPSSPTSSPTTSSSTVGPVSTGTGSPSTASNGTFSQPMGNRTASPFPPPTGPTTTTSPSGTGAFSQPNGNRTGGPWTTPSGPTTTSSPSGTGSFSQPNGNRTGGPWTTSSPWGTGTFSQPESNRTGSPIPPNHHSTSSPSGTGSFSQPNANRTGGPFPHKHHSCTTAIVSTVTVTTTSTVTQNDCSQCGWGGYYGRPQSFGPPVTSSSSPSS